MRTNEAIGETRAEIRYRGLLARKKKGESWEALASRVNVPRETLKWWKQELRRRETARAVGGALPALLPVRVLPAEGPISSPASGYEVVLSGGRRVLRVPAQFEPDAVRALVTAVEAASC